MKTSHHESDCAWTQQRLDDFVDRLLADDEHQRAEVHLEGCAQCHQELTALQALLDEAAALPASIEPERDLWPAIESRLDPPAARTAAPAIWRAPWWQQIAAALAFAALGAGAAMSWGVSSPGSDPDGAPVVASERSTRGDASVLPASASRVAFEQAEVEYLRAKEALWVAVYSHRDELSPLQLELVESNLRVIDGAVRQLRDALQKDPEDPQLQKMLLANHRRGLDLLWDLVRADHA